jgi:hypothetical protein
MNEDLLSDLLRASPLRQNEPVRTGRECKLCSSPAWHFDYVDFNKSCNDYPMGRSGVLVEFFRCQRCELIFTDFCDRWTAEDFAKFVYNDEYGLVDPEYMEVRPRHSADELGPSLKGAESARILDYGSGSGSFAQEMKKRGFLSIESYDPFSHPVPPTGKFDIITCFDVIEHSATPRETLREIMAYLTEDGCVLVGQTLQPYNIEELRSDWWYIAPRNGHVTAYSSETMHLYARNEGILFDDFGDLFALSGPQRSLLSETIIERRLPRIRRHLFLAPSAEMGAYHSWQPVEYAEGRPFRWTRTSEVSLGTHAFAPGECRILLPFVMAASPAILKGAYIRAGEVERPLTLRNEDLVATFDFPDASNREVTLCMPPAESPASKGLSGDLRVVGLAVWCAQAAPANS